MGKTEGEVGTWSHCGSPDPHITHYYTVTFNEGPYPDIKCLGTPGDIPAMTAEDAEDVLSSSCARYLSRDVFLESLKVIRAEAKAEGLREAADIVASEENYQWAHASNHLTGAQIVAQRMKIVRTIINTRAIDTEKP